MDIPNYENGGTVGKLFSGRETLVDFPQTAPPQPIIKLKVAFLNINLAEIRKSIN